MHFIAVSTFSHWCIIICKYRASHCGHVEKHNTHRVFLQRDKSTRNPANSSKLPWPTVLRTSVTKQLFLKSFAAPATHTMAGRYSIQSKRVPLLISNLKKPELLRRHTVAPGTRRIWIENNRKSLAWYQPNTRKIARCVPSINSQCLKCRCALRFMHTWNPIHILV